MLGPSYVWLLRLTGFIDKVVNDPENFYKYMASYGPDVKCNITTLTKVLKDRIVFVKEEQLRKDDVRTTSGLVSLLHYYISCSSYFSYNCIPFVAKFFAKPLL